MRYGGGRPKASKGGNRDGGNVCGAGAMGIWLACPQGWRGEEMLAGADDYRDVASSVNWSVAWFAREAGSVLRLTSAG
jgi:hypothetical protein